MSGGVRRHFEEILGDDSNKRNNRGRKLLELGKFDIWF